jgi:threonine synthase
MGYQQYAEAGRVASLPRMCGFQAAGAAPIVNGKAVDDPSTIATAIRIGNPASWDFAVAAAADSGGLIQAVTDRDILQAYRRLAREGVFAEMASAASVAGLLQMSEAGDLPAGATIVCTLTGHGLKEPDWAIAGAAQPDTLPVDVAAVAATLGLR